MKISKDCKSCGSVLLEDQGHSYCVFKKNMSETIIMKNEPDICIFLDNNSAEYKSALAKFVTSEI